MLGSPDRSQHCCSASGLAAQSGTLFASLPAVQALGAAVDTPTACLLEAASCSVPELLRGEVLTTPGNLLRRMVVRCHNGAEAGELRLLVEQAASQAAAAAAADAAGGADAKQDAALAVVKHKAAGAALEAKLQVAAADASRPSRLAADAAGNLEQVQRELARQMRLAEQAMAVAAEAQAEAAVCRQEQAKLAERQAAFEKEVRERMAAAQQAAASAELKAEAAQQAAAAAELKAEAALQAAAAAELKAEAALQAAVAAQLKVEAALQAAGVAEVNTAAAAQEAVAQVRRDARAAHEELVRTVKGLELQVRWRRRTSSGGIRRGCPVKLKWRPTLLSFCLSIKSYCYIKVKPAVKSCPYLLCNMQVPPLQHAGAAAGAHD